MINPSEISDILKQQLVEDIAKRQVAFEEEGTVLEVGDGVAHAYGLHNVEANELVQFENGVTGVAMNLEESDVGIILLDEVDTVTENMKVRRTGAIASIEVGEGLLGRVINVLAKPIDGKGPIEGDKLRLPLERKAPGVIFRQPVNQPLQTGLKAIDSMIPIGRGQRELIIGDRQIGKTAIAVDTIINQRAGYEAGKPVYCIYVAIGQKASTVAALVNKLEESGALPYTIVVAATAADSASMRYYAPFAGAAIGEYFRDTGRDALVIYDDLSKHAVAYREISLILKRPSGREAYPGDIFYLHSRLLERAAKINENQAVASVMNDLPAPLKPIVKGGGSLTALPIIETQAGDVSAYIPTNVISITDGQIYLESALFNSGIRPAVNVGISVSRVGGNAQIKCMKKVAGTLKIAQAQYRELEAFTKFGGDIDPVTARTIDTGRKNERLLVQPQYSPMVVEEQVAIIYCGVNGLLRDVPLDKVAEFEKLFINFLRGKHQHDVLDVLRSGKIDDDVMAKLKQAAADVARRYTDAPAS
jgi:F-type H+-transporting ATPase subunit alpha